MTTDPGAPRTDELARNAALHALADAIRAGSDGVGANGEWHFPEPEDLAAGALPDLADSILWETDVNSAGVPVRRYVLRGAWEVNPAPVRGVPRHPRGCMSCGNPNVPHDHLCTLV
jgi:hypothetical protein